MFLFHVKVIFSSLVIAVAIGDEKRKKLLEAAQSGGETNYIHSC